MTEWNARDYAQQSSLQQAMAEEVLSRLTLNGDERILDVGCGDGKVTAAIAERAGRGSVVGVDPSREMVGFAAERFAPADHPNLRFEVADARRLPFRGEFDLVVSFNALHWVPEQETALRSIHTALRPGGKAFLRMVPQGPRESLEYVIEAVRQRPRWEQFFGDMRMPFAHFKPEVYREMAERAGFHVVRLAVEDKAWDFGSREGFAAFARATFVEWTQHLPEGDREPFIQEVLDCYQHVAAQRPEEANTFKFYQMEVELRNDAPSAA